MTHLWTELAIVEQRALRRGPRMRGLGDLRVARNGDITDAASWARANSGTLGNRILFEFAPGDRLTLSTNQQGFVGEPFLGMGGHWISANGAMYDDPTIVTTHDKPPSWWSQTSVTNGMISNGWLVALSVGGAAVLAGGGALLWRKRR